MAETQRNYADGFDKEFGDYMQPESGVVVKEGEVFVDCNKDVIPPKTDPIIAKQIYELLKVE